MSPGPWIRLATHPTGSAIVVNMSNIWRMDEDREGGAELHSLGANTGGVSASVRVKQSVSAILAMMGEGEAEPEREGLPTSSRAGAAQLLYRSSNGDEWMLERDGETGAAIVLHRANASSGGFETRLDIERFLSMGGDGPERRELLRLIGTLV